MSGVGVQTNINMCIHDVHTLRREFPLWDTYSRKEKLDAVSTVDPILQERYSNTATNNLLNILADNLVDSETRQTVTHLALGDSTSQPIKTNVALGNEVYRAQITEGARDGGNLETITFLDTNEANGNDLTELGLYTGPTSDSEAKLVNHSLISSVSKTSSITATFAVDLLFTVA